MLNCFFRRCYKDSLLPLTFADLDELEPFGQDPEDIYCTAEEVQHQLQSLDTSNFNGISAIMLKAVAPNIATSKQSCLMLH